MLAIARSHSKQLRLDAKLEYYFDDQGAMGEACLLSWNLMRDELDPALRKYLMNVPKFQDDRKCLPLQAADMYAWSVREHQIAANDINLLSYLVRGRIARAFGIRAFVTEELAKELPLQLQFLCSPAHALQPFVLFCKQHQVRSV